ncbi:hypothetical protein D1B33_11995 [Lysinibacillus yapensis]|uniref:Uncharacterized protein n=1 Tax=Ureibacillus yapensis TaxID=2304605 RepID=A0A396SKT5_9BACL|nr:hypothetical protein [Lysinibacillus yapensis]RHW35818.1 hypothetical protein D1B33_11995 [Lysinibacillus yapensis]
MKKFTGIVIIILSSLLGLFCAIGLFQEFIVAAIVFWIISFPLYIWGQKIRTTKYEFKQEGKRLIKNYIFVFFILPLAIYLFGNYSEFKENTFVDEHYIVYEPASGTLLGELSIFLFLVLVFLLAFRFLNSELKRKRLWDVIIFGTILLLIGFNVLTFSDYRGIHKEDGLVSSNWKGEKDIISFEEIESVFVEPYVHHGSLSNSSDETRFVWRVTFQPKNQEKAVAYQYRMMSESNLEQTMDIKKIAMKNDIPFIVGEMSPETFEMFVFDLEMEELDKEHYYELFQVNNE